MFLNESYIGKPTIVESSKEKLPSGVLLRVTYPVNQIGKLNANNRVYEKSVWEKVLSDATLQEMIKNRRLFGHAEHPQSTQSDLQLTSHVIVDMKIDEATNTLYQTFDVVDTPCGRIVDALFRAECGVGVSTRAEGELEEVKEGEKSFSRVIPDKYKYTSTDFTADPSVYAVLPMDVKRNLVTEVKKVVNESTKPEDKKFAEAVLEGMTCKDKCKCGKCGACKEAEKKETKKDESVVHIVSDPSQSKVNVGGDIANVGVDSQKTTPVEITITTPDAIAAPVAGAGVDIAASVDITAPAGETPVPPTPDTALDTIVADEGPEHEDAETEEEETEEHEGPNPEEEKDEDEEVEESKLTEILRVDMVAKVTENGGYLEGAARQDVEQDVFDRKYWNLDDNDDFQLVELKDVPIDIAKRLEKQGTSAQGFKDGYEAAKAASAYYNESKTNEALEDSPDETYEDEEGNESDEPTGPQPEDIVYGPAGQIGDKYSVRVVDGENIGEFDDFEQVIDAITSYMAKNNIFPDVWFLDDHGGATLDTNSFMNESKVAEAKKKAKGKPKMGGGNGAIGGVKKVSKKNESYEDNYDQPTKDYLDNYKRQRAGEQLSKAADSQRKEKEKKEKEEKKESKTPKQEIMDLKLSEASMKAERDKAFERLEAMSKVKSALDSAKKSNTQLESKLALSTKELDGLKNLLENKTKENKDLLYKNKELQVNTKTLQEKLDKEIYNHKEDILEAETRVRKEVLKAYFDSQIKESQLNVQDNILALLEDCNSIDDVNDLLSKAVQAGRRTLLSNPVKKAIVERSHPETDRKRDETFELMDSFNNTKRV